MGTILPFHRPDVSKRVQLVAWNSSARFQALGLPSEVASALSDLVTGLMCGQTTLLDLGNEHRDARLTGLFEQNFAAIVRLQVAVRATDSFPGGAA